MPPAPRLTFSKQERLRGKLRIESVVKQGKAVSEPPFRLIGLPLEMPANVRAQIAFAVPKRNLRDAVDRNTTKRRMREAYRLEKPDVMARLEERGLHCAWLFVYQGKAVPAWELTQKKITRCLHRWLQEHG
ncbi:MAG: ribonuclease P protein component [Flavobacteriales bacterium]